MRVHRAYWSLPKPALYGVVAIGNFDGVHRGHRALIEAARTRARELAAPLGVVTFEPHPREVLTPQSAPPRITPFRIKAHLLADLGIEDLFALAFNEHLRQKTPEAFVHDVLAGGLGVRHVVIGYDFRFGYKAKGDAALLSKLSAEYGFGVTVVDPVTWRGEVCSSSRTRAAVAKGEVALAGDLLGHPFMLEGGVAAGEKRGRELGYPTANLHPPRRGALVPPAGIYALRASYGRAGVPVWRPAVASLGVRPTFDGEEFLIEVHLLDGSAELYGSRLCCAFIDRLRDEVRFASVDDLKAQMAQDCLQARDLLASPEI
jgi:riboflavin kinase / FMN adenylyltransferase